MNKSAKTQAALREHRLANARKSVKGLTPHQCQLLLAIAEGLDNEEIAARFGTTYKSAGAAISRIYRKMGLLGHIAKRETAIGIVRIIRESKPKP